MTIDFGFEKKKLSKGRVLDETLRMADNIHVIQTAPTHYKVMKFRPRSRTYRQLGYIVWQYYSQHYQPFQNNSHMLKPTSDLIDAVQEITKNVK